MGSHPQFLIRSEYITSGYSDFVIGFHDQNSMGCVSQILGNTSHSDIEMPEKSIRLSTSDGFVSHFTSSSPVCTRSAQKLKALAGQAAPGHTVNVHRGMELFILIAFTTLTDNGLEGASNKFTINLV
jgi:hypothetical protein